MSSRASSGVGVGGNAIFLLMCPGRSRAESRISLFVAMKTLIFLVASNPSSWSSSSSAVRCTALSSPEPPSCCEEQTELLQSMTTIDGVCSRAMTNSSLTILAPSPMNFCTIQSQTMNKGTMCVTSHRQPNGVFSVPGVHTTALPWAARCPGLQRCLTGSWKTSVISLICLSSPPIILQVDSGTFFTIISDNSGSALSGRILCRVSLSFLRATSNWVSIIDVDVLVHIYDKLALRMYFNQHFFLSMAQITSPVRSPVPAATWLLLQ